MKFSIITITYNSIDSLEDTITSVVKQTHPDVEYIIVDGQSTDGTVNLITSYNHVVTTWVSEPDNGLYDALNKGVAMATGEVIGFVHSDDMLADATVLEAIAKAFNAKNVDGVYGDLDYIDKQQPHKIIRKWRSQDFKSSLLKKGWMPAHPTLFLKKAVYDKHGQFDTSFKIAADYEFMLRVLSDTSLTFSYMPKVFTKMRVGGASNRSLKNILQKSKEDWRAIQTHDVGSVWTLVLKNTSKLKQFF